MKIMNTISKDSRIILLSVICILAPVLASCGKESADFLTIVGGSVLNWGVNETLNCAANKKDCITNAGVKPTIAPDKAIENYYKLINQRQYAWAWTVLSPEFHMRKPELNYNIYTQWWDKVNFVEIDSIDITEKSKNKAIVNAKLKYLMKDGTQDDDSGRFTLVLNSDGKWLIDDKN